LYFFLGNNFGGFGGGNGGWSQGGPQGWNNTWGSQAAHGRWGGKRYILPTKSLMFCFNFKKHVYLMHRWLLG